jgi:hypothetical protein
VFSLTKIVEVAHFNMGRIRWAWEGRGEACAQPSRPALTAGGRKRGGAAVG